MIWTLLALSVVAAAVALPSAPVLLLLGEGSNPVGAAFHGLFGTAFLLSAAIGLYLAIRLFTQRPIALADLRLTSIFMPISCVATVLYGNWIYIWYRLPIPSSPKSYFMAESPAVHQIFFEFKEYAALFTVPLTIAVSFLVFRFGKRVLEDKWLKTAVATLLVLIFFYGVLGYGLGAVITRLKSI